MICVGNFGLQKMKHVGVHFDAILLTSNHFVSAEQLLDNY